MSWPESSNTADGFVLDLRGLNQIDISLEDRTVALGPGSTWSDVYAAMGVYNMTVAGGRIDDVGVAGFLLGGKDLLRTRDVIDPSEYQF